MRVLHVLGEIKSSGAEVMLRSAADEFSRHGVVADVLSTGMREGTFSDDLRGVGYRIHHIPFSKSPIFFVHVYRLMGNGGYDVVHLHTERANFWLGLTALFATSGRVLRTVHAVFVFGGRLGLIRGWQRRLLSRLGVVHVAISPTVQQAERVNFGLKTRLVNNWYDDMRYRPPSIEDRKRARLRLDLDRAQKVLLSVGNCSKVKNHVALLHALAGLPKDTAWAYLHLGQEESGYPERRLAESLGIADRVRFLGNQTEPKDFFAASDIYVMPSLCEGFGVAAVEALAMGMPSVFTDVEGLRDFREHFEHVVYSGTDSESLRAAIEEVLSWSSARIDATAKRISEVALAHFRPAKGVAGYMKIYQGA